MSGSLVSHWDGIEMFLQTVMAAHTISENVTPEVHFEDHQLTDHSQKKVNGTIAIPFEYNF